MCTYKPHVTGEKNGVSKINNLPVTIDQNKNKKFQLFPMISLAMAPGWSQAQNVFTSSPLS
jgi:hypothetical protein